MKTKVFKGAGYAVAGLAAVASVTGVMAAPTYAEGCAFSHNDTCYETFVAARNAAYEAKTGAVVLNEDFDVSKATAGTYGITGDMTIDLNGHKISHTTYAFSISGKLTVKDSVGTGSIESPYPVYINGGEMVLESGTVNGASYAIYNSGGTFTMNGGTVKGTGYGVALVKSGTATINDGEIKTSYMALSGNNTIGDMNVYMNGGTVTSTGSPAIYMPSQVDLNISGGTVNGGVLIRMGQVDISGGTINAPSSTMTLTTTAPGNIPAYAYSGAMNLPNAITVMGGAYDSTNETYGNSLNMKITGGTMKSTGGAAVAVYDLGKTAQKMSATITGGNFVGAAGKDAVVFQTLAQAGVEPISGYGVVANTLPSKFMAGGTYSVEPLSEYIADNYVANDNSDGTFTVATTTTFEELTTDEGLAIDFGTGYVLDKDAVLVVEDKTNDEILALNENIKKALDIRVEDENGNELSVRGANLTISVPLEDELLGYDHYVVYYINDAGEIAETFDATVENGVLTFQTSHLSTYAIAAYNDSETVTSEGATATTTAASLNPNTLDNVANYAVAAGAAAVVMLGAIVYLMKREA